MIPSAGFLDKRVTVLCPSVVETQFGPDYATDWTLGDTHGLWANIKYMKGNAILHQGNLMMAETLVMTCRPYSWLDAYCRIKYQDKIYRITSFNKDFDSCTITLEKVEA